MKSEPTSKKSSFPELRTAIAVADVPSRWDEEDSSYDPNDAVAVEEYWSNDMITLAGHDPHQDPQLFKARTDKPITDNMYVKNASAIVVLIAEAGHAALVAQLPAPLMVGDGQ